MIDLKWTRTTILSIVNEQLQLRKLKNERPNPKKVLLRLYRTIAYWIFGQRYAQHVHRKNTKTCKETHNLGIDEFGRDLDQCMEQYVTILKRRGLKVRTVIILGSRAKNRWKPKSDIDTIVIASDLPRKGFFGLRRWYSLSDRPIYIGVESYGCSEKDFLHMLENFHIAALDAIFYGKIVYDDGFWSVVKKTFKKLEKKYQLQEIPLKQMLLEV